MLEATERVVGRLDHVVSVGLTAGESSTEGCRRIEEAASMLGEGRDVVFLVDLGGSTPANFCQRIVSERQGSAVVTGLNLPMLFKLATVDRSGDGKSLAKELAATGVKSIHFWSA